MAVIKYTFHDNNGVVPDLELTAGDVATNGYARFGPHDVFAEGRSYGIAYGDLNPSWLPGKPKSVNYNITITRTDDDVPSVDSTTGLSAKTYAGSLEHGVEILDYWGPGTYGPAAWLDDWVAWYEKYEADCPAEALSESWNVGPNGNQDVNLTESTGSGRLKAHRHPFILSLLSGNDPGSPVTKCNLWGRSQAQRGMNFYYSNDEYSTGRTYDSWRAVNSYKHYLGRGYGESTGGFSTTGSGSVLPTGITWGGVGWSVPGPTHMTIDSSLCGAYLYGDRHQLRHAHAVLHAGMSNLFRNEYFSSRAIGRSFHTIADLTPAFASDQPNFPVSDAYTFLNLLFAKMTNGKGRSNTIIQDPGDNSGTEGGHMTQGDVFEWLAYKRYTYPDCETIARSDVIFQVAQTATGLMHVREMFEAHGLMTDDLNFKSMYWLRRAADFLMEGHQNGYTVYNDTGDGVEDFDAGAPPYIPTLTGFADDSSQWPTIRCPPREGGYGHNPNHGTFARWPFPTMAQLSTYFNDPKYLDACYRNWLDLWIDDAYNSDYKKHALEGAPALAEMKARGWWYRNLESGGTYPPEYTSILTGTASTLQDRGTTKLIGSGTLFTSEVQVGKAIAVGLFGDYVRVVGSIQSDTELTFSQALTVNLNNQPLQIQPEPGTSGYPVRFPDPDEHPG